MEKSSKQNNSNYGPFLLPELEILQWVNNRLYMRGEDMF